MLRRDSSNSNSWSKIWLRVDSKTYGIDLVVTFESNGEKKIAKQVFLLQLRRLLSKFYCFCLADTVAVSLSFSLLLSLLQLQCHNPFLFQFAIVCGWERQCEEERESERESIGLRLGEGIQFPSVMAWLWGTAAALIRLGGSKFSSHNIQKWFFLSSSCSSSDHSRPGHHQHHHYHQQLLAGVCVCVLCVWERVCLFLW